MILKQLFQVTFGNAIDLQECSGLNLNSRLKWPFFRLASKKDSLYPARIARFSRITLRFSSSVLGRAPPQFRFPDDAGNGWMVSLLWQAPFLKSHLTVDCDFVTGRVFFFLVNTGPYSDLRVTLYRIALIVAS